MIVFIYNHFHDIFYVFTESLDIRTIDNLKEKSLRKKLSRFRDFLSNSRKFVPAKIFDFVELAKVNSRENSNFLLKNFHLEIIFLSRKNLLSKTQICLNLVESLNFSLKNTSKNGNLAIAKHSFLRHTKSCAKVYSRKK